MRVLLLATNRCAAMVPVFPLGLACIAANLDRDRHEVRVWDAMFQEDWRASLREAVRGFGPEVVGLSIRNVDDQDMRSPRFFLDEVREMVEVCRAESGATLVGGGAGFSMFPDEIMRFLRLDYGVIGEGERVFPAILDQLAARRAGDGLPGVIRRDGDRLVQTPPAWSLPLDGLAFPDRTVLDMAHYFDARGTAGFPNTATVQAKRGCPLTCSYCATFAVEGTRIRVRSPKSVADELEELAAQGFDRVQFVDSVFTNPPGHARAVCEELIRRKVGVHWSATVSPAFGDAEVFRLMKEAGCAMVMIGNESGCERTLSSLGKGFAPDAVERCFTACQEVGLGYNAFLLIGAPGEDRDTVRESVDLVKRFEPAHVSVSVGIRLYTDCELTRVAVEEGQLAPDADLLTPRFYLSPAIRDWIWEYIAGVMAEDPRWAF